MTATECDVARQRLAAAPPSSLLGLALDGCVDIEDEPALARAVEHVRACAACQSWRETELHPELFHWRHRASKYCCGEMFRAVAGPERYIYMQKSGPEMLYCWTFGAQGPVIRHCPWCGGTLPAAAFEDDRTPMSGNV